MQRPCQFTGNGYGSCSRTPTAAMTIRIRKGLDVPISGSPEQCITPGKPVRSVGVVASDYPRLRTNLAVALDQEVRLGQPLFHDKRWPEVVFASPGAGRVTAIHRGPRRQLGTVVVRLEGDAEEEFASHDSQSLAELDPQSVRTQLCRSGLWPAFRTRPFDAIPAPRVVPHAIFITAIDTNPLAADPRMVIEGRPEAFRDGVAVVSRLTEGLVYVCHAPGPAPSVPEIDALRTVAFEGPHPAGLPGTHIHCLDPVDETKTVWHIGYQDVIRIGALFRTGRLDMERIIALGGPVVRRPRLVRTRVGASTEDLLVDELEHTQCRVISGSVLAGRRAAGHGRYLGPYDLQLSVLREDADRRFLDWLRPGFDKYSSIRAFTSSLRGRNRTYDLTTSQHGSPRAMVPIGNFESVMPLDILPAPLLKALIVRDVETAQALGCLELSEEDLALCSFVCCSKYEYGSYLRETLDALQETH